MKKKICHPTSQIIIFLFLLSPSGLLLMYINYNRGIFYSHFLIYFYHKNFPKMQHGPHKYHCLLVFWGVRCFPIFTMTFRSISE